MPELLQKITEIVPPNVNSWIRTWVGRCTYASLPAKWCFFLVSDSPPEVGETQVVSTLRVTARNLVARYCFLLCFITPLIRSAAAVQVCM